MLYAYVQRLYFLEKILVAKPSLIEEQNLFSSLGVKLLKYMDTYLKY